MAWMSKTTALSREPALAVNFLIAFEAAFLFPWIVPSRAVSPVALLTVARIAFTSAFPYSCGEAPITLVIVSFVGVSFVTRYYFLASSCQVSDLLPRLVTLSIGSSIY
jgi:hypothetical protein